MDGRRIAEGMVALLFVAVIGLVFQQIATSMAAQGIASGGPYNDAASYPRVLALVIAVILAVNMGVHLLRLRHAGPRPAGVPMAALRRPAALLGLFALYLWALGVVGYLLASVIFMGLTLVLCGERSSLRIVVVTIAVTFGLSFVFGSLLDVVLPRGRFGLALPW